MNTSYRNGHTFDDHYDYDEFLGFGKKAKARRAEKKALKKEKKLAKIDIKKAKAQAIRQGTAGSGFGNAVGSILGGIFGNKSAPAPAEEAYADQGAAPGAPSYASGEDLAALVASQRNLNGGAQDDKKTSPLLIGGIVIAALVAVVVLIKVLKK